MTNTVELIKLLNLQTEHTEMLTFCTLEHSKFYLRFLNLFVKLPKYPSILLRPFNFNIFNFKYI